ncbi:hypothetical protein BKA65DRAFT_474881 [Rhexocercosporidium sp. MPI-PUGE-AT-0058]|nr:hypothetical protein BKA65DRAFT_474881 [Rhexocercosporidium sp. MPI-PUGE-AT-0058]
MLPPLYPPRSYHEVRLATMTPSTLCEREIKEETSKLQAQFRSISYHSDVAEIYRHLSSLSVSTEDCIQSDAIRSFLRKKPDSRGLYRETDTYRMMNETSKFFLDGFNVHIPTLYEFQGKLQIWSHTVVYSRWTKISAGPKGRDCGRYAGTQVDGRLEIFPLDQYQHGSSVSVMLLTGYRKEIQHPRNSTPWKIEWYHPKVSQPLKERNSVLSISWVTTITLHTDSAKIVPNDIEDNFSKNCVRPRPLATSKSPFRSASRISGLSDEGGSTDAAKSTISLHLETRAPENQPSKEQHFAFVEMAVILERENITTPCSTDVYVSSNPEIAYYIHEERLKP